MKIYVASSWRNPKQPKIVEGLRGAGHEVYDFRNPVAGSNGFHWSWIDEDWINWSPEEFKKALEHPVARQGFCLDWDAMRWADACVMVLPCGRSAHLESGYFVGAKKPLIILLAPGEPELMYKMANHVSLDLSDIINWLSLQERN